MSYQQQKRRRFRPFQYLARWWVSRKELPTAKRWLYIWGLPFVVVWLGLFVLTGLEAHQANTSGWQSALDVALTVTDPFSVHTWLAVALVVATVFVVPVVIGAAVGLAVEAQVQQMRRPKDEVLENLTDLKDRVRELEAKATSDR